MREMVGQVVATAAPGFQLLGMSGTDPGYDLNPGNPFLFPWLSSQAVMYEMYRFTRMSFVLQGGNPATLAGRVYMAFDYDIDDQVPATLPELGSTAGMVSDNIFQPRVVLNLDIKRLNQGFPTRYTSGNAHRNAVELRTAYGGFFVVAASGCTGGGTWDLSVEYTCELIKPQPSPMAAEAYSTGTSTPLNAVVNTPLPTNPQGTVHTAIPGVTGPYITVGTPITVPMIDMGAHAKGRLDLETVVSGLAGTPLTNCPGTSIDAYCFDQAGAYLGSACTLLGITPGGASAFAPANWATPGHNLIARLGLDIAALRVAVPLLRFAVPYLYNGNVKGPEAGAVSSLRVNVLD